MSDAGTAAMIDVALAQVAAAIEVSDHLGTIIPEIAAMEAENRRLHSVVAGLLVALNKYGDWRHHDEELVAALAAAKGEGR